MSIFGFTLDAPGDRKKIESFFNQRVNLNDLKDNATKLLVQPDEDSNLFPSSSFETMKCDEACSLLIAATGYEIPVPEV